MQEVDIILVVISSFLYTKIVVYGIEGSRDPDTMICVPVFPFCLALAGFGPEPEQGLSMELSNSVSVLCSVQGWPLPQLLKDTYSAASW